MAGKYDIFAVEEEDEDTGGGKYEQFLKPVLEQPYTPPQIDPSDPLFNPTFMQEASAVGQSLLPSAAAAGLNALQAPTLGWSDEAIGMIPGGDRINQFQEERNAQYPAAAVLAETGGALATGVLAGPRVAAQAARLPSPWQSVVADIAAGGSAAGVYSAGKGEEGNRFENVPLESGIGAVAGPVANVAARVGSSAFEPLVDYFGDLFRSTESQASRQIGRRMAKEGVPTDMEATQSRQDELDFPEGQGEYINADSSEVQAQQLKELYDRNPSARGPIDETLEGRQRATPKRVVEDISEVTGLDRDARRLEDTLLQQSKRDMANAGYGGLADQSIPITDNIFDMFTGAEAPFMKRAYQNAEKIAAREGNPIPKYDEIFGENGSLQDLPLPALDYMQRAFRNAGKPNISNPNYDNISWRKLRDRFLNEVDSASPQFKEVRKNYATQSGLQDAARQGQDIYKLGDARDIADYVATLSGPELTAFRRGAVDAVENQVRNMGAKSGNVDTRLAGTQNKDEILDIVFGENVGDVRAILGRENAFNNTYSQILGGSATSKNLGDSVMPPLRSGMGIGEVVTDQIGRTARGAFQPSQQVLDELISQLTAQGYTAQQARQIASQQLMSQGPIRAGQGAAGAASLVAPNVTTNAFGFED